MPGLVPGIHVLDPRNKRKTWMAGTSPAMTEITSEATSYIVAPGTQGANSGPPKSKLSLLVG